MKAQKIFLSVVALALAGCASESQIKSAIEKDPSIVFSAIEKNPEKFMEAAGKAQAALQKKAQDEELAREEYEKTHPLDPTWPEGRAVEGSKTAPIKIVEFADLQCYYCAQVHPTMQKLAKEFPGKIQVMFKNLPLPMHPMAVPASLRYEAIALQDHAKAIKFKHVLFETHEKVNKGGEKYLDQVAAKVGADVAKMKKEMNGPVVKARIQEDMNEAEKFRMQGTPGFIINGTAVRGALPYENFKSVIEGKLAELKK